MFDKKEPLESLLPKALEALQSIQQSLSVLADAQLAAELNPDHESRLRVYRLFDAAKKRDSDAADYIESVRKQIQESRKQGVSASEEPVNQGLKEALDQRRETLDAIADLTKLFPAQSRLHRLTGPQETR